MNIIHETEDNYVAVTKVSGKLVYEEIIESLAVLKHKLRGDILYQIIICVPGTNFEDIFTSTSQIASLFQQTYQDLSNVFLAIVSDTDLGFGISRMIQIQSENEKIKINVFRTEDEARSWLDEAFCLHFQDVN